MMRRVANLRGQSGQAHWRSRALMARFRPLAAVCSVTMRAGEGIGSMQSASNGVEDVCSVRHGERSEQRERSRIHLGQLRVSAAGTGSLIAKRSSSCLLFDLKTEPKTIGKQHHETGTGAACATLSEIRSAPRAAQALLASFRMTANQNSFGIKSILYRLRSK